MGNKDNIVAVRLDEADVQKLRAVQQYEQRDNQSDLIRVLIRRRFFELNLDYMKAPADAGGSQ